MINNIYFRVCIALWAYIMSCIVNCYYNQLWQQYQYHYKYAMCRPLSLVKVLWIMVGLGGSFFISANEASRAYFRGASEKCRFFENNVVAVQVK